MQRTTLKDPNLTSCSMKLLVHLSILLADRFSIQWTDITCNIIFMRRNSKPSNVRASRSPFRTRKLNGTRLHTHKEECSNSTKIKHPYTESHDKLLTHIGKHMDSHSLTHTLTHTETHRETNKHTHTHKHTHRDRTHNHEDTHTLRHLETHTHTHT